MPEACILYEGQEQVITTHRGDVITCPCLPFIPACDTQVPSSACMELLLYVRFSPKTLHLMKNCGIYFYPRPPSARTGIVVVPCVRLAVRPSVRPPVCPFVRPERRYRSNSKDFSGPEIGWDDAQYHEADHYLRWSCSANLYAFHGRGLSYRLEILRFGVVIHSSMKQIAI